MISAQKILTSSDKFYINLGLERMFSILELLDNPQEKIKCIHVAGTNGKGSVCASLNQVLIENNLKTGLYTSPHLFSYTERIKINNTEISKKDLDFEVNFVVNLAKKNDIHLTEFEILTACAFKYFAHHKVDIVILEVGLGGRLDATNVIKKPLICAITDIALEHTERLGNTIEKIAFEKAGIIKKGVSTVVGVKNAGLSVIKNISNNLFIVEDVALPQDFPLQGAHQKRNLALVFEILKHLPFKIQNTQNALKNIKWRFRIEYDRKNNIIIDGCHNPAGIKALRDYLDENFKEKKIQFVFGCLKNKNYTEMLELLVKNEDELLYKNFSHSNSLTFEELPEKFKQKAKLYDKKNLKKDTLKVFCGSLYMLGEMFS